VGLGLNNTNSTGAIYSSTTLPWLLGGYPVQTAWGAVNRDIVILDADNEYVASFNCTSSSLSTPANYDALRALMVDALNY
jgi:hypothetical protein